MRPYRDGSVIAVSYNSGLIVFVYDDDYADAIREAAPKLLEYYDDESHLDTALMALAQSGKLMAYELAQDDSLAVEVSVGPPLSDAELKDFKLGLPPVKARLSVPSGKLFLEGYDSLRIGPDEPMEDGAVVGVPPGEYVATLYRSDPFDYSDEDEEEDSEDELPARPLQVITLTPADQAPPLETVKAMLKWERE